jgi:hypothetical protein
VINQLDEMLRLLLDRGLNDPPAAWPIDVAVRPPDDSWRTAVNANGRPAVNVYLVEVREAREQRTSAAVGRPQPAPFRVDCHYLLSAWIPTADPNFATPTVVEDWLLGETIRIMADAIPLNATGIHGSPLPADVDPALEDLHLPTELLPPDGYANLADFWTGLGQGNTWHPAAHLVVTLPITRQARAMPPSVRTVHLVTGASMGSVAVADGVVSIGGMVRAAATGDAIAGASVRLLDEAAARTLVTTVSDQHGHFTFDHIREGRYQLTARTTTAASVPRAVSVPGSDAFDLDIP